MTRSSDRETYLLRPRWRRPVSLQPPLDRHGIVIAGSHLNLNKAILTE
jgi:hypothetical protein